ncbi:MAG: hypothetical protein Q8N83_10590 [Ignavibacteria bacterium]|nr:hypothetical protein [Ignavibacteria bacterium]MDP3149563.1 hypothetical protein [Ignavibacteria bacterium]
MTPLTKVKKTASDSKRKRTADNRAQQSKIKLIKALAGNVEWSGNLSESRKSRTFNDPL